MDVSLPPASPVIVPFKMLLRVSIIQRIFSEEEGKAHTRGLRCAAHEHAKGSISGALCLPPQQGQKARVLEGRTVVQGPFPESQCDSWEQSRRTAWRFGCSGGVL